jgi:monofunctional biosynthetic peptidoglycan transglycosylase
MRRLFRIFFLVVLGVVVGIVGYESIMFVRVLLLRNGNPSSTSLIDTRIREAQAKGQQPKRQQVWVSIDKISPNLQRAVLAGEDTNFLTHRGFDYEAIQ